MTHDRLHALADGIFAIVMTLLIFQLAIPTLAHPSNHDLLRELHKLAPIFLSLFLSFAVLFSYWRAHNFIFTNLSRNADRLDQRLINYNALFLFFITVLPFSATFLGKYWDKQTAIVLYGVNLIVLSLSLHIMREHILHAKEIEVSHWNKSELRNSTIRTFFPVVCSVLAIALSFASPLVSAGLFGLILLFSFSLRPAHWVRKLVDPLLPPV